MEVRSGMLRAAPLVLLLLSSVAAASAASAEEPPVRVEVDGDPAAYFVDGFSLHVAVVGPWKRLDFGCYSVDEPTFLHGNEGWSVHLRGYGFTWDYFVSGDDGFFAGVGVNLVVRTYVLDATSRVAERHQLLVGPHIGWRFMLGEHFYLAPWLAVEYAYRGEEVTLDGETFDDRPYVIFPTLYAGWRF
jgi:hypothetical protein